MKLNLRVLGMLITLTAWSANSQTAGGTGADATGNPPPGVQNQQPIEPGQPNPNGLPPAQLNQDAGVKVFDRTNQTSIKVQDQAMTEADQILLRQIREQLAPHLRVSGTRAPVAFNVHEGDVTLVGIVPSNEEKKQIETLVQQIPGVVNVVDQLVVGNAGEYVASVDQPQVIDQAGGAAISAEADVPPVVPPQVVEVPAPETPAVIVVPPPTVRTTAAVESKFPESRPGTWSSGTNLPPTGIVIERVYETNTAPSGLGLQDIPPEWKKIPRLLPPGFWDPKN